MTALTDDSSQVIPDYIATHLEDSPVRFRYIRQDKNLGYDGNLRASLAAGQGEYLFILGNDDALAQTDSISRLVEIITKLENPDVLFSNFHDYGHESELVKRAAETCLIGSGPDIAARNYRSLSFCGRNRL